MFFNQLPITVLSPTSLISWVIKNWPKIPDLPEKLSETAVKTIQNSGEGIRRVGSSLVFGTADGGKRVIAFIDQAPQKLASLEAGQRVIGTSLSSLQTLTTVSLGVAALSPIMLGVQYCWLRGQFGNLQKRLDRLEKLIDTQTISRLNAGLESLETGSRKGNQYRIENAYVPCNEVLQTFASRLRDLLHERKKKQDRKVILHLTQHFSIAICAAARCDIAMGYDDNAELTLSRHYPLLAKSTQAVFQQTIEKTPGRFLKPKLTDDNDGIEFLRSVVQQARDNNVLPHDHSLALASGSLPAFVEYLLGESPRRNFFRRTSTEGLKDELCDVTASVEDTSRVYSLRSMIDRAREVGMSTQEMINSVEHKKHSANSPFVAWAI